MKKRTKKMTAIGLAVGVLVAGSTSAMAFAGGSAYETYKDAALETAQMSNVTVNMTGQLKQNGKKLASGNMEVQQAGGAHYSSGAMNLDGKKEEVETSVKNGVAVIREGSEYKSYKSASSKEEEDSKMTPNAKRLTEIVTDTLVGDVKNQFTASGDTISVHLDGAQVPELANVAFAAIIESKDQQKSADKDEELDAKLEKLMSIKKDAKIKRLDVTAKIKDNCVQTQDIKVLLAGKDANGKQVEIEAEFSYKLSKIGSTTPKTVDTKGKKVKEIKNWD